MEDSGFRVLEVDSVYGDSDVFLRAVKISRSVFDNREFVLSRAVNQKDLISSYDLRFRVYCLDIKSLSPKDYPSQKEIDSYDKFSIVFIMLRRNDIIGTVRLIKDSPTGFLIEESFSLPRWLERGKTLEASRVAIAREYRGSGFFLDLCGVAKTWSLENGYRYWCLACQEKLLNCLYEDSWDIKLIGQPTAYHNTVSVPLIRTL